MLIKLILKQIESNASHTGESIIGEYVFDGNLLTVGSDATNTIVVAGGAPEQAVIVQEGELLTLHNSGAGTVLNGQTLPREAIAPLTFGDEIRIGDYVISIVCVPNANESVQKAKGFLTETNLPLEFAAPPTPSAGERNFLDFLPEQNGETDAPASKPARNFADVLNTLRTEEDKFYFTVKNENQAETRIPLEQTEMPLGFDAHGKISCAVAEIAALYAIVRKDWSGIVVESQKTGALFVNDETINTTRRLRNGDRLGFNGLRKGGKKNVSLELHEPSSLVTLESILDARPNGENRLSNGAANAGISPSNETTARKPAVPITERNYFGYFTFLEVVSMAIGTLIAAVLTFLLLELTVG